MPERRMPTQGDAVRLRLAVRGAVQGVGFRPFVHRLAVSLALRGWVRNGPAGVTIEVEGAPAALREFLLGLEHGKPPRAAIQGIESLWLEPAGLGAFAILPSEQDGPRTSIVLPDLATCPDCRREILDPTDRRFRYPFTNCTNCGPRFSIIEAMPYDRDRTTMRAFPMCAECRREYEDPADRRFHAEPVACPKCGPRLRWLDPQGHELACGDDAVGRAVAMLRAGGVLAVKGLGGYQLMVAARPDQAVLALRQRKHREEKPFALMFPNLEMVREACYADEMEERVLASPEGPIVLLRQRRESNTGISPLVAPGLVEWGVMLPTTPLHHLILHDFGGPVVATSGNLSDEPICTEEEEALARLGPLVDGLLVHDRPVVRPVDDSVVRVLLGREMVLRRARGYAPWPVPSGSREGDPVVLAVGADLKNTVALGRGPDIVVGQHVGDLGTELSFRAQQRSIEDLPRLLDAVPEIAACDLHPDYHSRRAAERTGLPMRPVQHHLAHALACLAENEVDPPALAVTWDGTGFGTDGTIWGGEFLLVEKKRWRRLAHLRPFPLVGGDGAAREPRRAALGLLHALFGEDLWNRADLPTIRAFTVVEMRVLRTLLDGRRQTVPTTSMGRFLDALASLCDVRHVSTFEAQTAMDFEACAATATPEETLTLPDLDLVAGAGESPWSLDWAPLVAEVVRVREQAAPTLIAEAVHRALVRSVLAVARRAGIPEVALTGGCFQNRILLEGTVADLRAEGFRPCWPQRIPPNDGGISLGQVVAVRSGHA